MILAEPVRILRFRHGPGKLITAGLTAWTLLTITYVAAELHFTLVESRMGAFHIFVLGAAPYGLAAVFDWVFRMCAGLATRTSFRSRRPQPSPAGHARTNFSNLF